MKIFLQSFVVVILIFLGAAHAQDPKSDSLLLASKNARNPEIKCDLLNQLALRLFYYDLNRALTYATEANKIANRNNYVEGQVKSLTSLGMYAMLTGNYHEARINYRKAIAIADDESWNDYPANTFIQFGNLYRFQSLFDSASFYYAKAETLLGPEPAASVGASLYQSRGLLSFLLSDFQQAKNFFARSANLRASVDDDLLRGESFKNFCRLYSAQDHIDSAFIYFDKVHELALRYRSPELFIFHNIYRGELYFKQGEFVEATKLLGEALDSITKHNYRFYYPLALKNIGQVFEWEGDYQRALEFFLNALKVEEGLNHRQEIAHTFDMMGWIYANQRDFVNAQYYAAQSHKIFKAIKDDFGRSDFYTLSGFIAFQQKNYERALAAYDTALTIRKWFNVPIAIGNTLNFMVRAYTAQGRLDEAMKAAQQVFQINVNEGNKVGMAVHYNNMSEISLKMSAHKRAEEYALQSLAISESLPSAPQMRKSFLLLSNIYSASKRYPEAIQYYNRYITLSDSLYNSESSMRQAQLNAFYELEKREKQISELSQKSFLQQTALQEQETRLHWQNMVLVISLVALIFLSGLLYLVWRYYRIKRKAHDELNELHKEIVEKNEEIQAQSEELIEGNEILQKLNRELTEKQEEIEAQSEELREANQIINEINRDLEGVVQKRTVQLKEAYKELDTFFYRSSHDFRRPLTTFMGLAEVAKVTVKDKNALELFEKVNETAQSLDKMIIKLQSISDVGSQQLVYKQVLIREIFDSVCASFQEEILKRGVRTKCSVQLKNSFISYPAMVKIIIENLVENSINFSSPVQPLIKLNVKQCDHTVQMELQDNGQGIPKEFQDKIFNMYFRGSERSKGNGLGLYIVKKAVEKLGGEIGVASEVGAGTTFTIKLPMEEPETKSIGA